MDSSVEKVQEKIAKRKAKISVLGLGYVGLPLALRFAEVGFAVTGIDVDEKKVEGVKGRISYIQDVYLDIPLEGSLTATTDPSVLQEVDVAIICVPTPLGKTRDPDLSLVMEAARFISKYLHSGQLVILESTTYPGTTREVLQPLFEETGFEVGVDFFLGYSPERIDPGNESFHLLNTPKVVSGITPACLNLTKEIYGAIVERIVPVSNTDSAEVIKLLENMFRSVNIALVNEFAVMCHRLNLNVWEVINAAATKPFGFMPFYPGPGLGGHCIPIDPHYLSWKLKLFSYKARFIDLADEINREMPRFVVEKVVDALNRVRKSVNGSKIIILGVAYKKDSNDIRESPALDVMEYLHGKGAKLFYYDPHIPEFSFDNKVLHSEPLDFQKLSSYDASLILADHTDFNARMIVDASQLVIDTRNLTRGIESKKIVRL